MLIFVKTFTDKTPHPWQVSASHDKFPPRLRQLARTRSLLLRPLVRTSSFHLRLRWGPHVDVEARDLGPHMNVALPRRSSSPATTRKAPVLHAMQAPNWRHVWAGNSDRCRNASLYVCAVSNTLSRPTSAARQPHQNQHSVTPLRAAPVYI
jgi:hypothetical protein